jgi:two-component system sensor histidine kinase KdpD
MQTRSAVSVRHREMRGIGVTIILVAVTTVVAVLLRHYIGIHRGSMLYLIPVMLLGYYYGLVPALLAAISGVLLSGFLFFARLYTFRVASPQEALNFLLFIVIAVVVSQLSALAKRHITLARKRERELTALYDFSRRLAAAPNAAEICVAIQDHLTDLLQSKVVLLAEPRTGEAGKAGEASGTTALPERVRDELGRVGGELAAERVIDAGNGNLWVVRRIAPKDLGMIAVDLGDVSGATLAEVRQRIDDALTEAAATLERLDVARALNEAKMRSETELLRDALIGSVSHELRTPLASILGAATVLANAPALASDQRLVGLAGVVRDEAERLNGDIQNLLDATAISRQQARPKLQWVEPVDVVNAALERGKRRLALHPIELDLDSNLPIVRADPAQIEQALAQILDNAAKYSPDGSPIRVTAGAHGQSVVLSVSDRGAGMTAEEQRHVGQRFFRGSRHAALASGSGLGLWIAGAFMTANGGKVEVASDGSGRGATVSLHLPVPPTAPAVETLPAEAKGAGPAATERLPMPVMPATLEASIDG